MIRRTREITTGGKAEISLQLILPESLDAIWEQHVRDELGRHSILVTETSRNVKDIGRINIDKFPRRESLEEFRWTSGGGDFECVCNKIELEIHSLAQRQRIELEVACWK